MARNDEHKRSGGTALESEMHPPSSGSAPVSAPPPVGPPADALITAATHRPPFARQAGGCGRPRHRLTPTDALWASVILLASLVVRWPFVTVGDTLLNPDEAIVGLMAMDIAAGEQYPIYFYGQRYMGALESYLIAVFLPLFDDPAHALRFGPTLVFAFFCVVQFLMLTRWFGRGGGLIGAASLLAASPMFMHWSISARGGYIEILLWGSALLWIYSEWFATGRTDGRRIPSDGCNTPPADAPSLRSKRLFRTGLLVGTGLWINPSIAFFVIPILLHAGLHRPLARLQEHAKTGDRLERLRRVLGRATTPVLAIAAILLLNVVWAVWVDEGRVRHQVLLGLFPKSLACVLLGAASVVVLFFVVRKTSLMDLVRSSTLRYRRLIFGLMLGALPSFIYTLQAVAGFRAMDPSLPMGIRPLWKIGETLIYLAAGLPSLFAADARPFLHMMGIGRPNVIKPLDSGLSSLVIAGNWTVLGGVVTLSVILLWSQRRGIDRLLRLRPHNHSMQMLLMLAVGTTISLYLLGGCTMNYSTVRYLVPLWAFVPGLIAAAYTTAAFRRPATAAVVSLFTAWGLGQYAMHTQLGNPHPLHALSSALTDRGIDRGIAEPLDAHLLSFMTQRRSRLAEFESFWVRLPHHRDLIDPEGPVDYIVETAAFDWAEDLHRAGWRGEPPPESQRFLRPRLRTALARSPELLLSRTPLTERYELFRLRRAIPERNQP